MGYSTEVIIVAETADASCVGAINDWLHRECYGGAGFLPVSAHVGGSRKLYGEIWIAALHRHMFDEELTDVIRKQPWSHPDRMQIMFRVENDGEERYKVFSHPFDGADPYA